MQGVSISENANYLFGYKRTRPEYPDTSAFRRHLDLRSLRGRSGAQRRPLALGRRPEGPRRYARLVARRVDEVGLQPFEQLLRRALAARERRIRHACVAQRAEVRRGALRLRVEDGVAAARVSEHVVPLLLLVHEMQRVLLARVAAVLVRVAVGEALCEDAVLCVEDRDVGVHHHLQPAPLRRRQRSRDSAHLDRIQVEGRSEAAHAQVEEGGGCLGVGDVEAEVAVNVRHDGARLGGERAQPHE
eukprot:scaffold70911_cov74-Phaeocystis_antarctica.AAC.2